MAAKYVSLTPEALISLLISSIVLFVSAHIYAQRGIGVILFLTLAVIAISAFSAANAEITYSKTRKAWLHRSAFVGVVAGIVTSSPH